MHYDGSGKLGDAIARLYGFSPKNNNRIAELVANAKAELGVTGKAKVLPDNVKLSIWQWHYDRLNPVQNIKQGGNGQDSPVQSLHDATVQDVKQTDNDNLELLPDSTVQNVKQDAPVQLDEDMDSPVYDFKQIHFAVTVTHQGKPKRTTVMLEGYLVKALQRKHGLTDNPAIRAWIEQAIKGDAVRFDSFAPLTRQVKRIIIESLV